MSCTLRVWGLSAQNLGDATCVITPLVAISVQQPQWATDSHIVLLVQYNFLGRIGIGLRLGWDWVGIGLELGWDWVGIGLGLGWDWVGFGLGSVWD